MGSKTQSQKEAMFLNRPSLRDTLIAESRETISRVPDASSKWRAFKDCDEIQLDNDWSKFIGSIDAIIDINIKRCPIDLLSNQEADYLQIAIQPVKAVCENTHHKNDEEEKDNYFQYCCADIDIPKVKSSMIFPACTKKKAPDTIILNDNRTLYITELNTPDSLDSIRIPPVGYNYSVTICYHVVVPREFTIVLKAIQLYLSTGDSYTIIIDQTCLLKNFKSIHSTKFGHLITDPSIKRICWNPEYIQNAMKKQLGFSIGTCIDLSQFFQTNNLFSMAEAIDHSMMGWQDKNQYDGLRNVVKKKDSAGYNWDCSNLPNDLMRYCTFEGWAVYSLFLKVSQSTNQYDYP